MAENFVVIETNKRNEFVSISNLRVFVDREYNEISQILILDQFVLNTEKKNELFHKGFQLAYSENPPDNFAAWVEVNIQDFSDASQKWIKKTFLKPKRRPRRKAVIKNL